MALTPAEIQQKFATIFADNNTGNISEADLRDLVKDITDYLGVAGITSIIPTWAAGMEFNTDGSGDGEFCRYTDSAGMVRLWQTKADNNTGHLPPSDPNTTENTWWIEVSASTGSALTEWAPGIYGSGLVIVFYDNALIKLNNPTRPYNSSNIETELSNGDWVYISSGTPGGGGGGPAIENTYATIAAMLADQANQTEKAIQFVTDASADVTVDSGYAYYELAASTGVIGDYRKLSEQETMVFADDSIYEHIFFAALSPDFGVITRPWDFKVSSKIDTGGTATITTSADAAYSLGTTVTAGGYLKVTANTLNMRSSLKVERA